MIPANAAGRPKVGRGPKSGLIAPCGDFAGSLYWRGSRPLRRTAQELLGVTKGESTCSFDSAAWSCSSSGCRWPRAPADVLDQQHPVAQGFPGRQRPLQEGRLRAGRRALHGSVGSTRISASPTSSWATATTTVQARQQGRGRERRQPPEGRRELPASHREAERADRGAGAEIRNLSSST